ncbi:MAG: AI-2E family transporter [Bacteroidales bacterium]|nr:AI-2E family transporter [Bacteroidales bacterium]MDD3913642.1 AI-2E family transporter [Bacteroidales bacterium]
MNKILKYSGIIFTIILVLLFVWKFTFIVWYILIAGVISFIGAPIVERLRKIKINKKHIPNWLAALISLLIIVIFISAIFVVFVPLIVKQANVISNIDFNGIADYLQIKLAEASIVLQKYGIIGQNGNLLDVLHNKFNDFVKIISLPDFVGKFFTVAGDLFMGIFSVIFISFFFLKDDTLFTKLIMVAIPDKYNEKVTKTLNNIKHFLSRYFIGMSIEVIAMATLETIGLKIIGVEGALLLGIIGGFCNIIPYLGPFIGGAIAVLISGTTLISAGAYDMLLLQSILVVVVFGVSNFIDNMVLQPLIYSQSVDAHPLEIFIVILVFGSIGGVVGMLLAIPGYTVIRVIAKEFLSNFEIIRKITSKMKTE